MSSIFPNNDSTDFSNENFEIINKINPKIMRIDQISCTFENIEFLISLNCPNSLLDFNYSWKYFELIFLNTTIQIFDVMSDQRLGAECESIKFDIIQKKLKNLVLLHTEIMDYLFIPFDSISKIKYSGLKIDSDAHTLNRQFEDLDIAKQIQSNGFAVPLKNIFKLILPDDCMLELLSPRKSVKNQIIKARHIDCEINISNNLFRIYKLFTEGFSRINFSCNNLYSEAMEIDQLSLNLISSGCIKPKFSRIERNYILSSDEFNLWKEILSSRQTRFSITSIGLILRLPSECQTILSLCADCPELEFINLQYVEVNSVKEQKLIENAETEFKEKFGFIKSVKILKLENKIF